jgi:CBASS immunity sensor of nucleotide second messenger signals
MPTQSDALPRGLLLLSHAPHAGITPAGIAGALPGAYRELPRHVVELDVEESIGPPSAGHDWSAEQRALEEQFRATVKPLRDRFPDYNLVYFGDSSVPLTLYLGYMLEAWQRVEVVPRGAAEQAWGFRPGAGAPPARLLPVSLPDYKDHSPGAAIVRVSTAHRVDPLETRRIVLDPVLVEIDIALEHPAAEAFREMDEMLAVAAAFRQALDRISDDFPGIQRVHLFASVQPGMALLLGSQISKTRHPAVQTYQYLRNAGDASHHLPALLINGPRSPEPVTLGAEQAAQSARDRTQLARDLERMKGFIRQEQKSPGRLWLAGLLDDPGDFAVFQGMWRDLPTLSGTPLGRTRVDIATKTVEDSFRLTTANEWQLDDGWLLRLARRIPDEDERHRALRMLVLHEAAHRGPQGLTGTLSKGVGRFPKVLEEIDYHADVWGMLHEHALTALVAPAEVDASPQFFQRLILTATETMWAFDDDGGALRQVQVRRLNRYLIWYWQYLLLERAASRTTTLREILAILAQRPIIELAGPTLSTHDERVFLALDASRMIIPELCIYSQGRLHRHGPRLDFSLGALLDGVSARDGKAILDVLRAAAEQTAR